MRWTMSSLRRSTPARRPTPPMPPMTETDTPDPQTLQELVEEWRSLARMAGEPGKTETFIARAQTYGRCAEQLEGLIDE